MRQSADDRPTRIPGDVGIASLSTSRDAAPVRTAALSLLGAAILAGCGAAEPKPTPVVAVVEQPPGETRAAPTPLPEPRADDPPASTDGKDDVGRALLYAETDQADAAAGAHQAPRWPRSCYAKATS